MEILKTFNQAVRNDLLLNNRSVAISKVALMTNPYDVYEIIDLSSNQKVLVIIRDYVSRGKKRYTKEYYFCDYEVGNSWDQITQDRAKELVLRR